MQKIFDLIAEGKKAEGRVIYPKSMKGYPTFVLNVMFTRALTDEEIALFNRYVALLENAKNN